MARDFLAYWKPKTLKYHLSNHVQLNHAASNQFGRVSPGDRVWLVTVLDGRLRLIGSIRVDRVTNQHEAQQAVGCKLWEASYHILPSRETARDIADLDIHDIALLLRFESAGGKAQLCLSETGAVNPQQLQTMRVLSSSAVDLLEARLEAS